MGRDTDGEGLGSGATNRSDVRIRFDRRDEGEGTGPEKLCGFLAGFWEINQRICCGGISDMNNHRVMRGSALGAINRRDRALDSCIGAESINGLGRERDQAALSKKREGGTDASVAIAEADRVTVGHVWGILQSSLKADGKLKGSFSRVTWLCAFQRWRGRAYHLGAAERSRSPFARAPTALGRLLSCRKA